MPSELMKALRAKYKDPREAMKVLGLDEKLLEVPKAEDEEEDDDKKAKDKAKDADPREFLKSKLSEDDMEAYDAMCKTGLDEKDDEDKKAEDAEEDDDEEKEGAKSTIKDKAKDGMTKAAMDAAINAASDATARRVREAERGIRVALAEVEPWVGRLAPTLALDSATDVYRHAAKALGVKNADKLHADALFPIIQAQPKPGEQKQASREMAHDSSSYGEAVKLAPGLEHITVGA